MIAYVVSVAKSSYCCYTLSKTRITKCPLDLGTWGSWGLLRTVALEARMEGPRSGQEMRKSEE